MRLEERPQEELRCAYCHAPVGLDVGPCRGCGTRVHADCLVLAGRCPTLGCRVRAPRAPGLETSTRWPRRLAWAGAGCAVVALLGLKSSPEPGPMHWNEPAPLGPATWHADASPAPAPPPPVRLPGDVDPWRVVTVCRTLLADPALRGATLRGGDVPPALRELPASRVHVHRHAVVVVLAPGDGLLAMAAGAPADTSLVAGPRSCRLEAVADGLWRYTRW